MRPVLEVLHDITNFSFAIWFTIGLWKYINYGTQPKFEEQGVIYCILVMMSIVYLMLA